MTILNDQKKIRLIGHRGFGMTKKSGIVENTLKSFKILENENIEWAETDVQITFDKIPILFHDFKINENCIWEKTYEELSLEVIKSTGEPLCTLKDLLENTNLKLNIELKYPTESEIIDEKLINIPTPSEYLTPILEILSKYDKHLIFSSFEPRVLEELKKRGNYKIMFLFCPTIQGDIRCVSIKEALNFVKKEKFMGIVIDSVLADSDTVRILRDSNLEVYVYGDSVDADENLRLYKNIGVGGIIADDIPKVKRKIKGN